jgi:hypothetical protein
MPTLHDARGAAVDLRSLCFDPLVIRIDPGQRVTWTNQDPTPHTVTAPAGQWGSPDQLVQGQSVSYSFPRPGTFPYACLLHPGMVGAVVVGDGGTAGATLDPAIQPADLPVASALPVAARQQPAARTQKRAGLAWPLAVLAIVLALTLGLVVGRRRLPGEL